MSSTDLFNNIKNATKFEDHDIFIIYNYMQNNKNLWTNETITTDLPKIVPRALKKYQMKNTAIVCLVVYCIISVILSVILYFFAISKPICMKDIPYSISR